MGYQPIYDGKFDLAINLGDDLVELLNTVAQHKLMVTDWETNGPGGGCPTITLRGTRRQFIGWLNSYYDDKQVDFLRNPNSEADTWINAVEAYAIKFVA